jgi:putative transposase
MRGGSKAEQRAARDAALLEPTRAVIRQHPSYGYRRIKPDLEEVVGEAINHKRLRRLLGVWDLALQRVISRPRPSRVRQILSEASGRLNLLNGRRPTTLEVLSTDFTELRYAGGGRKAWLMALIDVESVWVPGWAVGPSANRHLALRAWKRTRTAFKAIGAELGGTVVHQDQDPVFTSYAWLRALLLRSRVRISYSENGARGNPWIESFWARFKQENHSLFIEAATLSELRRLVDQQMRYYNRKRRHSSIGNQPPLTYLNSKGFAV